MIEYAVQCDACGRAILQILSSGSITAVAHHGMQQHETRVPRAEILTVLLRTVGKDALLREIDILDQALRGMQMPPRP
jgi:hypothetical protein